MQRMSEQPYHELRALFDHLVQVAEDVQQHLRQNNPRRHALAEVLCQAHAYQQASCERCGAQFAASQLHEESYAVGGYQQVCPQCNQECNHELGGQP